MTRPRMWREEEEEETEEQEGVWRGREWGVAGRGGSRPGNRVGAGKTAEPGQGAGAGGWEWEAVAEDVGAGRGGMGEEGVVLVAGRGEVELVPEEAQAAWSGGKPALEAGRGVRATAAGREGTTTPWNQHPAQMLTATWWFWLWTTGWVLAKKNNHVRICYVLSVGRQLDTEGYHHFR